MDFSDAVNELIKQISKNNITEDDQLSFSVPKKKKVCRKIFFF